MTIKETSDAANLSGNATALLREDSTSSAFLDSLQQQGLYEDAVRFLAHDLEVAAGVKWAVACIKSLQPPDQNASKNDCLEAADQWTKTPIDPARWAAKNATDKSKDRDAAYLAALAAFMSGGSITASDSPDVYPPPFSAQKMVVGAVRIAVVSHEPEKLTERYQRAVALGRKPA